MVQATAWCMKCKNKVQFEIKSTNPNSRNSKTVFGQGTCPHCSTKVSTILKKPSDL
jgi:hypothetical protein